MSEKSQFHYPAENVIVHDSYITVSGRPLMHAANAFGVAIDGCAQVCRTLVINCVRLHSYSCENKFLQERGVARLWEVARCDFLLPRNWVLANECWGGQWCTVCLKKNIPDIFSCNSRKHCRIFI